MSEEPKYNNPVYHPKHYTEHPSGVECIDITQHFNFNLGNAIKYIWRAGLKDESRHIEDLEKALFYVNQEIARVRYVRYENQKKRDREEKQRAVEKESMDMDSDESICDCDVCRNKKLL